MDDHQAVQLERAPADDRYWETLAEMRADQIEGHKEMLAAAQRAVAAAGEEWWRLMIDEGQRRSGNCAVWRQGVAHERPIRH